MTEEQFRIWARGVGPSLPLAVKGHSFTLEKGGVIRVDGGTFVYEEALELVRMLNSRNPLDQLNASFVIWERNGVLRLMVLAIVALLLIVVIALATR